ncbi:UNVERIFIED_CONTAM: DUF4625 domain-containing protein [Prevotella sp. 15_C9]
MNYKFLFGAIALLGVFTFAMTSCSDDENNDTAKLELTHEEIGHDGEATIGKDIHLECEILAEAKIKQIEVEIKNKTGKTMLSRVFNTGKYVGVLETTFHEHIDVPSTLPEGKYDVIIKVTDMNGQMKSVQGEVNFIVKTADVKTALLDPTTHQPVTMAKAGDKVLVRAEVKSMVEGKNVNEIELEFHGVKGEYEVELSPETLAKYLNKSAFTFEEVITIPKECKAGVYHFHFTVKAAGHENTGEVEDFKIK